jgi:hypothetical protein
MNEHTEKALAWMREVVGQAFAEAQSGDTVLLNKLGFYPSLQYYINNVHGRGEIAEAQWQHWRPEHLREVQGLYDNYLHGEEAAAATTRIASLEEKMATLIEQLKALAESEQPAPKPAAKKGRPRKVVEAEAVAEEEPEDDAEDEKEEDAEQGQEEPEASADQAEEPETES